MFQKVYKGLWEQQREKGFELHMDSLSILTAKAKTDLASSVSDLRLPSVSVTSSPAGYSPTAKRHARSDVVVFSSPGQVQGEVREDQGEDDWGEDGHRRLTDGPLCPGHQAAERPPLQEGI